MWFGLYSRNNNKMDSSGFEHIFAGVSAVFSLSSFSVVCQKIVFNVTGEIKGGKVSGFHNWIQFYLLEQRGKMNYYSHSFNGPVSVRGAGLMATCCDSVLDFLSPSFSSSQWTTYPDVLGMQFMWDGYYKQVGSAIIGCSPEFDFALYSLCYITRPGKQWVYPQFLRRSVTAIFPVTLSALQVSSEPRREGAHHPDLHLEQLLLRQWEKVHRLCLSFEPLGRCEGLLKRSRFQCVINKIVEKEAEYRYHALGHPLRTRQWISLQTLLPHTQQKNVWLGSSRGQIKLGLMGQKKKKNGRLHTPAAGTMQRSPGSMCVWHNCLLSHKTVKKKKPKKQNALFCRMNETKRHEQILFCLTCFKQ